MPAADFLYSSPYDALIGKASTGGYVGRETVSGVACSHVAYRHPGVDWDLWVAEQGDPLPKRFRVTDKTRTPARTVEVMFDKWVLGATVTDAAFTPGRAGRLRAHSRGRAGRGRSRPGRPRRRRRRSLRRPVNLDHESSP